MYLRRRLETFVFGGATLYHQTDDATAKIILKEGMKPGNGGVAGGGIYFATTPELTGHKAHRHGVILEATVALGRILTLEAAGDRSMTLQKLKDKGFESVCIARPVSSGQEYVVYNPKQVLSIRRHADAPAASTIEPRGRDDNDLEQGNGNSRVTPAILGNSCEAAPRTLPLLHVAHVPYQANAVDMAELHALCRPEISEETLAAAVWRYIFQNIYKLEWLWAAEEAEKVATDKAAADKAAAEAEAKAVADKKAAEQVAAKAAAEKAEKAATEKAAALQRFDGDAPKVDQILAKMRELGYKDFSDDEARVALKEYGHDRSGHENPVEKIVQMTVEAIVQTQMIYGC